jgi:hypothetical protein
VAAWRDVGPLHTRVLLSWSQWRGRLVPGCRRLLLLRRVESGLSREFVYLVSVLWGCLYCICFLGLSICASLLGLSILCLPFEFIYFVYVS